MYGKYVSFVNCSLLNGRCGEGFWAAGTRYGEAAVVERLKQGSIYGLSAGTQKSGRCEEVAVSGDSTVDIHYDFNETTFSRLF